MGSGDYPTNLPRTLLQQMALFFLSPSSSSSSASFGWGGRRINGSAIGVHDYEIHYEGDATVGKTEMGAHCMFGGGGWWIKSFDTVTPHSSRAAQQQQQKRTMMMGDDKFVLMYKDQTRPESCWGRENNGVALDTLILPSTSPSVVVFPQGLTD